MHRILVGVGGSVAFGVVLLAMPAIAPAQSVEDGADLRAQFVGTWALVRVERHDADGERLPPPEPPAFGAGTPVGFLMYDAHGHMGVVIEQEGRQRAVGARRTPDEALAAVTSYTSYFGPYTVNAAEGYVTHHVEGSLSPGGAGQDNRRYYELSGDELALKPPVGSTGVQLRIVWERVTEREDLTPEERRFVGFWAFDEVERRAGDGEALPANQWANGYVIYMPSGQMAVHLARPGRMPYAGGRPTRAEADAALGSYASYFGPFSVHADRGYVVHHRVGSSNPNGSGVDAQRFYRLDGDRLILMPPPATIDGRAVQSFIHWRRLGARD